MNANQVADLILSSVKKSNLNFHIQESPFSLLINLRKTFIKNKNGNHLLPPSSDVLINENVVDNNKVKVKVLEEEKSSLNDALGQLNAELSETRNAMKELDVKLEKAKMDITEVQSKANESAKEVEKKRNENITIKLKDDELNGVIESLGSDMNIAIKNLKSKDNEIRRLENKSINLEEQLKNKRTENKILLDENKNISCEKKKFEVQVKAFKKPAINIHKSTSTVTVQIEAQTQTQTEPAFFNLQVVDTLSTRSDLELSSNSDIISNPAELGPALLEKQCSGKCEHKPQCILREPRPPPSPTITFLYNEYSKYHQHMMLWSKREFDGHPRCFAVENENYGCDDCTWLKWWYKWHGENHGFPDIPEWIYKKYL